MNAVVAVGSSTAWGPVALNLNEVKRYSKSVDVTTTSSRMTRVFFRMRYANSLQQSS